MAVPIRCRVVLELQVDIDTTEKAALKGKMTQVVQDLKTEFPNKITANNIFISTGFKDESWSV